MIYLVCDDDIDKLASSVASKALRCSSSDEFTGKAIDFLYPKMREEKRLGRKLVRLANATSRIDKLLRQSRRPIGDYAWLRNYE